ncbi:type II toxin-antitoxin system HicA family toxin [Patescibacteria group bacterium]|nr:type II toxin-antitoxin system HicA family toxin [Patescibacteria group bacterium]
MPKTVSGQKTIKILMKHFGFIKTSQKGSHVKLAAGHGRKKRMAIVPLHRELAKGTIAGVLKMADVESRDFWKHV